VKIAASLPVVIAKLCVCSESSSCTTSTPPTAVVANAFSFTMRDASGNVGESFMSVTSKRTTVSASSPLGSVARTPRSYHDDCS